MYFMVKISMAVSASMNWIAWYSEIGLPKLIRCWAYSSERSKAYSHMPMQLAEMEMRPSEIPNMAIWKPWSNAPIRRSAGTRTLSNDIEPQSPPIWPMTGNTPSKVYPGAVVSTKKALMPPLRSATICSLVTAKMTA